MTKTDAKIKVANLRMDFLNNIDNADKLTTIKGDILEVFTHLDYDNSKLHFKIETALALWNQKISTFIIQKRAGVISKEVNSDLNTALQSLIELTDYALPLPLKRH